MQRCTLGQVTGSPGDCLDWPLLATSGDVACASLYLPLSLAKRVTPHPQGLKTASPPLPIIKFPNQPRDTWCDNHVLLSCKIICVLTYVIKTQSHLFKHLMRHIEKIKFHEIVIALENLEFGVLIIMVSNLRS